MDRQELSAILKENIPDIVGKEIWIWGTGHTAQLYQEGLKRIDKFQISGYCDNNPERWGRTLSGKPIVSPCELQTHSNIFVLICSPQRDVVREVGQQLDMMKIEWIGMDEFIFKLYREEVLFCFDLFEDQFSKDTYAHIISCRLANIMPAKDYIVENQYFWIRQIKTLKDEIFIDCGAFTGDTIEEYIRQKKGLFKQIIAFEPDSGNFAAMQHRINRLREEWRFTEASVKLYCCGVGADNSKRAFMADGTVGSAYMDEAEGENAQNMDIVSIDKVCKEPYDFLKADIEGYEYNMLLGAKESICANKPIMAVCIYHNAVDMFSIMCYIHSLVPAYKFSVRHHSATFDETVLYVYV